MREMKDSGIEWLGIIPKNWKVFKVKNIAKRKSDKNRPDKQVLSLYRELGIVIKSERDDNHNVTSENTDNYRYVEENDIVVNKMKAWQGSIAVSAYTGIVSPAYYVYKLTNQSVFPWFVHYMLRCKAYLPEYRRLSGGIRLGQWDVSDENFKNIPLPIPATIEEQKQIVDYLDAKCSKIDEIIEKQQAIIEKLKEYKLSIITEAVTSGINPDVEMKDSGSVWFGSIPINWEMKRLKYVFHIQKDIAGEEGHTVLSITQKGIIPKDFSNNEGQFANSYANYQLVHKGDFAMNHMDLLTGWVDISKYEGVTSPDYRVFVLNDKNGMCPEYYLYMMQMCYSVRIFYGLGQGVSGMGRWRLQADKFLNFHIPIPPYDEQKIIADYITDKVNHIEVEIDKRNKLVEKYQEYKKSLIYEVVTGKKEV